MSEVTENVLSYLPVRWRQMCALAAPHFHTVLSPARRHILAPFERGPTGCAEFVELCVAAVDSAVATGRAPQMQAARAVTSNDLLCHRLQRLWALRSDRPTWIGAGDPTVGMTLQMVILTATDPYYHRYPRAQAYSRPLLSQAELERRLGEGRTEELLGFGRAALGMSC